MNGSPRISVLIVSYNQEKEIGRALDSLLCQKEYLHEICINDDCSTDGTFAILQRYASDYPGLVKPVRNEENLFIFANTEASWKRPEGNLIYQLAGDDAVNDGFFRAVCDFVLEKGLDCDHEKFCIYTDHEQIEPSGFRINHSNSGCLDHDALKLKIRNLLSTRGMFVSRPVLDCFVPVSRGRSFAVESAQDCQPQVFAQQSFYLPFTGEVYYSGIGVSASMSAQLMANRSREIHDCLSEFLEGQGRKIDRFDRHYLSFMDSYYDFRNSHGVRPLFGMLMHYLLSLDLSLGRKTFLLDEFLNARRKKVCKRKKRILFLAPLPPPVHGSAIVSEQILRSKLVNGEFDADFVNISTSRSADEIDRKGFVLNLRKSARFAAAWFKAFFKLLTSHYDLCHLAITCYGRGFLKDAPFVLLCKLFGRKVVIHQHNTGMANYVDRPFYNFLLRCVYRNSTVILLSWHLYPDIERIVPKEHVRICPNGIDVLPVKAEESQSETPRILFLSNMLEAKGVLVLLDALSLLSNDGIDFDCVFVGSETKDFNSNSFAAEVRKRNLTRNVCYQGPQFGKDKVDCFEKADIFVLPSYREAFPLVILEAMMYSLPVVASNVGGIPDEVVEGETGLIVEPRDSKALASALLTLVKSPELRETMGNAGRRRVETLFSTELFERNLVSHLKSISR